MLYNRQSRRDIVSVFTDRKTNTLHDLSDIEVHIDSVILSLNVSTKHMLSRPKFQTQFFATVDRLRLLIEKLKYCKEPIFCSASRWFTCIIDPTYYANDSIRSISNEIYDKIKDVRGEFKMAFNLSGSVDLNGQVGADIDVQKRDRRNIMNPALHTNVIQKHESNAKPPEYQSPKDFAGAPAATPDATAPPNNLNTPKPSVYNMYVGIGPQTMQQNFVG